MALLVGLNSAGNRLGNLLLSRQDWVCRVKAAAEWLGGAAPLSQERVHQVVSIEGADVLLAISRQLIPKEISDQVRLAGVANDFERLDPEVVFCSFLARISDAGPRWIAGFVIEEQKEGETQTSPYRFKREEIDRLAEPEFIRSHRRAIFVNNFSPNGQLLKDADYLPPLTRFLGYLKAGGRPEVSHKLRSFYAARYEMRAAKMFLDYIEGYGDPKIAQIYSRMRSTWLPEAEERVRETALLLGPEDQEALLNSPK